ATPNTRRPRLEPGVEMLICLQLHFRGVSRCARAEPLRFPSRCRYCEGCAILCFAFLEFILTTEKASGCSRFLPAWRYSISEILPSAEIFDPAPRCRRTSLPRRSRAPAPL